MMGFILFFSAGAWCLDFHITFPSHIQLSGHFRQESVIDLHTAERSIIFPLFVFLYLLWIYSDQLSGEFSFCTCALTLCPYNNLKITFPFVSFGLSRLL